MSVIIGMDVNVQKHRNVRRNKFDGDRVKISLCIQESLLITPYPSELSAPLISEGLRIDIRPAHRSKLTNDRIKDKMGLMNEIK
jgi:hypothetical protein